MLTWNDFLPLGEALFDLYPDDHPLKVRFTELHTRVVALEDFGDDPKGSNEGVLEAIQMAWWAEYLLENPDADPYA